MSGLNAEKCPTGIAGMDEVLGGGLPKNQIYLLQGKPGTGKTTLSMQFLLEGAKRNEKTLYVTFSETKSELITVAKSHGWDLSVINIMELSAINEMVGKSGQNTLFHSSEVELNKVIKVLYDKIEQTKPCRIVIDSVSELRLLAETSLKYRRQMLAFKEFFIKIDATVILLDDMTTEAGDLHVQSIVHGVMLLEKTRAGYGVERREFHIAKMRGVSFRGGTHDYLILRGGITIFPRLVAALYPKDEFSRGTITSGIPELDLLVGGGLDKGTSNLLLGPAGSGKSTMATAFALSAAKQGKRVAMFNFEETLGNLLQRTRALNMDLEPYINNGSLMVRKVDPAELTPGHFASLVRGEDDHPPDMVVIDSLNGYIHAMPEQQFLTLQLHELLSYLNNRGVITVLVLSQAGIMGNMQSPLDITYLADTVVLTRYFEAFGQVRKAVSVIKKRTGFHENTLREFQIGADGIRIGKVLESFTGVFSGVPRFTGDSDDIMKEESAEQ